MQKSLVLLTVALLAPLASAQMADPPAPSTTDTTLYAHVGSSLWMNTVLEDPDHSGETYTLGFGEPATSFSAVFPLTPGLAGPLELDGAGTVDFTINFGCGLATNAGTLSTLLRVGTTTIAEHAWDPTACPATTGPGSYADFKASVTPAVTDFSDAEGNLEWVITFEGQGAAFMQTGQSGKEAFIVLPIIGPIPPPPAPDVLYEDLESDPAISLVLDNTTETTQYNWTVGDARLADYDINLTAGSAAILVKDADNNTLLDVPATDIASGLEDLGEGEGNWTVLLALDGAVGTVQFAIVEPEAATDADGSDGGDGGDGSDDNGGGAGSDGNETSGGDAGAGADGEGGQESPLPLATLIGALLIAVRKRR